MKLKGLLKAVAPTLLSTVEKSSPIAAVAVRLAAKKLNLPDNSTPEQIENELENRPDATEILESVELQVKQMEANLEAQRLGNEDRADARKAHKDSIFLVLFGSAVLIGFFGYVFLITLQPPAQADLALSNLILGNLFAVVSGISGWLYGQQTNGKK